MCYESCRLELNRLVLGDGFVSEPCTAGRDLSVLGELKNTLLVPTSFHTLPYSVLWCPFVANSVSL